MKKFEQREKILNLMDRNLEIRQKNYIPVKNTWVNKFLKLVEKIIKLK